MGGGLGPVILFGAFRLDAQRRMLTSSDGGEVIPLGARALDALLHLASRPGVLVSKSDLMTAIWPDVRVEENSLTQCISSLRRALGEGPGDHRYIVTESGRGYRFVAGAPQGGMASAGRYEKTLLSSNPQAYQLYVSGWSALTRPGGGNLERGLMQLEKSVQLDPEFAQALVCIADAYTLLGVFGLAPRQEVLPKARDAVMRALALDDHLAEAHAQLGHICWALELDFPAAEAACRRALEIDPHSLMAHHYLGLQMICQGRFDDALMHLRSAQAEEPLAMNINANIGMTHYYAGRYHEAIAQLDATVDIDPGFAHARSLRGRCWTRLGEFDRALAEFAQRVSTTLGGAADIPATLALSGRCAEANAELGRMMRSGVAGHVSPFDLATIYTALGEKDRALEALEAAVESAVHSVGFLRVDPAFMSLRAEPRFQRLLKRLRLQ
jgi:DNA-binding winged helix-turn-helix (wHTH) protein/Flp pilus assembly protein TadD